MLASYVIAESVVAETNMTRIWSSCDAAARPGQGRAMTKRPPRFTPPQDPHPDAEDVGALAASFELLPVAASEIWPGSSAPLPG